MDPSITLELAPFEGAEDNQTLNTQGSLRSFERSRMRCGATYYRHLSPTW